jgi:hypothetical protein
MNDIPLPPLDYNFRSRSCMSDPPEEDLVYEGVEASEDDDDDEDD